MTVMKCSVGITVNFSSSCAARVVHNTRARRKDNVRSIDLREQCQNKFNLHICSRESAIILNGILCGFSLF